MEQWKAQHIAAMQAPERDEIAHVKLYEAVKRCAERGWQHDGYAREYLIDLVRAARALLNMSSGRLDCGSLDRFYVATLKSCGVEE